MVGINVKWPGQHIAEDTTHRLVTDEQIEFWNSNGVIELTPTNFKDYVIDESKLYTTSDSLYTSEKYKLYENIQPGKYRIKLGFGPIIDAGSNAADDNDLNTRWVVKPDWIDFFVNTYTIDRNYTRIKRIEYGYSPILESNTYGIWNPSCIIQYIEMKIFDFTPFNENNDIEIKKSCYIKIVYYDNTIVELLKIQGANLIRYVNGVQETSDWNNATENGVYYSIYDTYKTGEGVLSDNALMNMPLPTNYSDIFDLKEVSTRPYPNTNVIRYMGKVTNSGRKIIQELELDIIPKDIPVENVDNSTLYDNFMKALGTKFIRYGFLKNQYTDEWSWTGWYIINYDLGLKDSNLTSEDFADVPSPS